MAWAGFGTAITMMSSTLLLSYGLGVKMLDMDKQTALLTGAGSAICGAAAIMAFEPVLDAKGHQTSAATVVLFGTTAMILYPFLYHSGILHLETNGWGIYIGATVHEVAQVVGAGSAISQDVLQQADQFLLTMAMTTLGMETSLQQLKGVGIKPFILAGFLFFWLLIGGYASVYMLTRTIHKYCRALTCSFARNESFVPQGTISAQAHSPYLSSVCTATDFCLRIRCEQMSGVIITAIHEESGLTG